MNSINNISKGSGAAPVNPVQQSVKSDTTRTTTPAPAQRNDNLNISGTAANSQRQRPVRSFRIVERSPEPLRTETPQNLTARIAERQQENYRENFRGARADTSEGTLAQSPQTREAIANQTTPVAQQRGTVEDPNNLNLNEQIAATQQTNFQSNNRGAALPANEGTVIQSPQTAARLAEARGTVQAEPPAPGAESTGGLESLAAGTAQRNRSAANRTPAVQPAPRISNFVETPPKEVGAPVMRNQSENELLPSQNPQQVDLISGGLGEN